MQIAAKGGRYSSPGYFMPFISASGKVAFKAVPYVRSVESVQLSNLSSYTFNGRAYPGGLYNGIYANMISSTPRHPPKIMVHYI